MLHVVSTWPYGKRVNVACCVNMGRKCHKLCCHIYAIRIISINHLYPGFLSGPHPPKHPYPSRTPSATSINTCTGTSHCYRCTTQISIYIFGILAKTGDGHQSGSTTPSGRIWCPQRNDIRTLPASPFELIWCPTTQVDNKCVSNDPSGHQVRHVAAMSATMLYVATFAKYHVAC